MLALRTLSARVRPNLLIVGYLALAAAGLLLSFTVYERFILNAQQFYACVGAAQGSEMSSDIRNMAHCDVLTLIHTMSEQSSSQDIKVGACDVTMYGGGVAVVGFLSFLLVYFVVMALTALIVAVLPKPLKKAALLACSLAFLGIALPMRPALWLIEFVVALCILWRLPLPRHLRAALMGAATIAFYALCGPPLLNACYNQFFSMSRLSLESTRYETLTGPINQVLQAAHLGAVDTPRGHDEGFPFFFLLLAFLIKLFRRVVRFVFELGSGPPHVDATTTMDFLLYFVGLHTLLGETATPSYLGFVRSAHSPAPAVDRVAGARTLAICFGLCSIGYCALLMLGYSPAVRLLFPHCDLPGATPLVVWGKLLATLVIQYLFLLCTSEASIGVARLFGFGLHTNFDAPLLSTDPPQFWRRWNTHWREFLMAAFYYPSLLKMVRENGGAQRPRDVMLAAMWTFFGAFLLTVAPLVLMSRGDIPDKPAFSQSDAAEFLRETRSDPRLGDALESVQWRRLMPSLIVYYQVDGIVVGLFLMWQMQRRKTPQPAWLRAASIAGTLLYVAALRCLLDGGLTLQEQARQLARAVGLGW